MISKDSLNIERIEWIKNVQLDNTEWLGAVHIYYYFLLLETQFGKDFNGFSILSQASYQFYKKTQTRPSVPILERSLYVVHLENHWVAVSNVDCPKNHWNVYDCLDYDINLLKEPLKILKHEADIIYLTKPKVQKQYKDYDCGLFALAFITNICFGRDPIEYEFDQSKMRIHYLNCAKTGQVTIIPGSRVKNINSFQSRFEPLNLN